MDINWETVGWVVIAASIGVIVYFSLVGDKPSAGAAEPATGEPPPPNTSLEIAWPALFIASMGMLTFKEVMDFAGVLLVATVITGLVWLLEAKFLRARRAAGSSEPVLVEMSKSFFPVILVVFLLRSFLYEPFKIPSGSMVPSLLVGDFILVNKFDYGIRIPVLNKKIVENNQPARGDVMVFRYPPDPAKAYIKRVVGIPGDTVTYKNKRLIINGQPIVTTPTGKYTDSDSGQLRFFETYDEKLGAAPHKMMVDPQYPNIGLGSVQAFPYRQNCEYNDESMTCKVPQGQYLMMGDSRDNSLDGRYWGFVPDENIVGRAVLVWMNFGALSRVFSAIK